MTTPLFFLTLIPVLGLANTQNLPAAHSLSEECRTFIEKIKGSYQYGWLKTRVDPTGSKNSSNPEVSIFYYYLTASSPEFKNPVVFFNGGPGVSSHGQADAFEKARREHGLEGPLSFIYFDQRGTGCSSPYPLGAKSKTLEALRWFGSKGIVYDAEALREKLLGNRKWKIFGQSYGAQIVYRYLTLFPQSVSKAFAHGNAVGLNTEERIFLRTAAQYQVTQNYLKKYPADRRRLFLLRLALSNKDRCFRSGDYEYCGFELLTPLVTQFLGYSDQWPLLHDWLRALTVDGVVSDSLLQMYVDRLVRGRAANYHNLARLEDAPETYNVSLHFLALFDWASEAPNSPGCQKIYERLKRERGLTAEDFLLDECLGPVQFGYEDYVSPFLLKQISSFEPEMIEPQQVLEAVLKYKITLRTYSGEHDCYVPKTWFSAQNKVFGTHVSYRHFSNSGHEGYLTEKKIFLDLLQ